MIFPHIIMVLDTSYVCSNCHYNYKTTYCVICESHSCEPLPHVMSLNVVIISEETIKTMESFEEYLENSSIIKLKTPAFSRIDNIVITVLANQKMTCPVKR
jgi:hypothetical protein